MPDMLSKIVKWKNWVSRINEIERQPGIREKKCDMLSNGLIYGILLSLVFVLYSVWIRYINGIILDFSVVLLLTAAWTYLKFYKKPVLAMGICNFVLLLILSFSYILQQNQGIIMGIYWLCLLVLPFISDYFEGVFWGTITSVSGTLLSVALLWTPLNNKTFVFGGNYGLHYPIFHMGVVVFAAVLQVRLSNYQIWELKMEKRKRYMHQEQLRYLEEQISLYETNQELIRKYRHDMRHYGRVLYDMLSNNEAKEAKAYIKAMLKNIDSVPNVAYCDNKMLNSVLSVYAERAKKSNCKITFAAEVPKELGTEQSDLTDITVLLANALENAVEAIEQEEGEKQIKLSMRYKNHKLMIMIQNTCSTDTEFTEQGLPVSQKGELNGIGTRSIRETAMKYNGFAEFSQEEEIFVTRIILTIA